MDRIRKALDLARAERDGTTDSIAQIHAPFDARAAQPKSAEAPREPSRGARLPTTIAYTTTRVFEPRREIFEAHRIINPGANDAAASAYRMLRTQVLQRMDQHGWRSMAILSPNQSDGKTTTAINLAMSLASDHLHTVLLVECDLKNPNLASALGIEPEFGLNDILSGVATVEQCLYHPEGFDRLVVLPARAVLANSSEALSGPLGRDLVADLRSRYPERIVIFDLPPVLGADDALAFLPLVDCGLVVAAEKSTRREDLVRCMELLRNTPIVGTVLNRATTVAAPYG